MRFTQFFFCCRRPNKKSALMAQTRQRKQPRLWLIIINHNTPNQRKWDVYIDDSGMDHEQLLRILPNNATVQLKRLPPYMNDIAAAVANKTIKCSFLTEALTDYLVNLTTRFPYEELSRLHDSPNSFLDQCIDYVVNCYIEKSVELFETVVSLEENKSKQFLWENYQDTFIVQKRGNKMKSIWEINHLQMSFVIHSMNLF